MEHNLSKKSFNTAKHIHVGIQKENKTPRVDYLNIRGFKSFLRCTVLKLYLHNLL